MASKFQFITELYKTTLLGLTSKTGTWTSFLRSASNNYKCAFDEQVLIFAQRPDATAVLEIERWNTQFGRWINKGAKGIAVFSGDTGKLKHYFDVSDTHESNHSRPVPIWKMESAYESEVIETLENTFGTLENKRTLPDAIVSASRNAVTDNMPDYLFDLKKCREDSYLEELDEQNVEVRYRQTLTNSIAYMLMSRLGVAADDYFGNEDFQYIYDFNTLPTINILVVATSDMVEMGLREISRTLFQLNNSKVLFIRQKNWLDESNNEKEINKIERSYEHGTDLQERGRLSGAEPANAEGAGGELGQIRSYEGKISQGASQGALRQSQDHLQADRAFSRSGEASYRDDFPDGTADGEIGGRDGGAESNRSDEVDGTYEQLSAQRGGDSLSGADLQLNSDTAGGENELPAFLNEHLMEAIVLDELGRNIKRQDVFNYFQSHKDYDDRCNYLKRAYTDTYVEIMVDDERVGYKKQENGLLMWSGAYLFRTSESVFSWGIVTELTEDLMERGEYKIKLGQQNLPSVTEQLTLFGMSFDDVPTQESFFPKHEIPQAVIDKALYTAGNESGSTKQMEKTRKGLEQKMDKLNDQSRKDDIVTFEELGVDRLFIDESHFYKNLFLYTKMRNVGGIAQTEAQKSSDLFMKCRYLDELTGGRGIVFATGTPISNSMVEMYTIQRYLQYETLLKHGLQHFDSWAANFGETVTAIELSPEGTGYRAKTRFAKFYNLPELMAMFKDVADIKTADMLNLPVPKANYGQ